MKIMRKIIKYFAIISIILLAGNFRTIGQERRVTGKITDEIGMPLAGVAIRAENMQGESYTDIDGTFEFALPENSGQLQFYLSGYRPETVPVNDAKYEIILKKAETYDEQDIIHTGLHSQKKGDVSGAIASVTGEELAKIPTSNLSLAMAGQLQGLFMQETSSEPGQAYASQFVRGISSVRANQPVIVLDGIVINFDMSTTLNCLSAEEIESISVLKDAASLALYGIEGADGVIVITTKRGHNGKMKIGAHLDQTFQEMTTKPAFISSAEYANLRNAAAYNDGLGENYYYTNEEISSFENGSNRFLYPNNNWRDMFLKDISNMQRLGVDVSGGNNRVRYFSIVNLTHEGGFYNCDQDEYKTNNNYIWANLRSNVDVKINRYLNASVRLAGNIKRLRTPGGGSLSDIYPLLYLMPSATFGPTVPETDPETGEALEGSDQVIVTDKLLTPPYGQINRSGYVRHTVTNISTVFNLSADLSFITPGLSLNGTFGYRTNSINSLYTTQTYEKWIRTAGNSFEKYGNDINGNLTYSKGSQMYYQLNYGGMMNYERNFGQHRISALAYMQYQDLSTNETTMPGLLPYRKLLNGFEADYGYGGRYLVKFDLGYSGSEQYNRSHRFCWTPAFSLAWVASEEGFLKDVSWLSLLKIRASWGKTATERSGLGRYAYLDDIALVRGGSIPAFTNTVTETQVGSPDISAEISKKLDIGIDFSILDNFKFSFDWFKDRMDNMVIPTYGTTPSYQGMPLEYLSKVNSGKFENKGYEFSIRYSKDFENGLKIDLRGWLTHATNKVIYIGETIKSSNYVYRKWEEGYPYGQEFGYLLDKSNGSPYFNSQQEIDQSNLKYEFGTPRVGDLKYADLNNDGLINECDKAPIGSGSVPKDYYAFSINAKYRSFDLSLLFQGVGDYHTTYSGIGVYEYYYDGVFGSLHKKAWTAERYQNGEDIEYPALSIQQNTNHQTSEFFLYDRSYLRLKNVEFGYALPLNWAKAIHAEKVRLSFSIHNAFTWDNMKSSDFGPEGSYLAVPVYRFYSIRLSLNF